ncbi:MAG: hypothetical protein BMS9Abin28_0797 [Anaerolineae bacterium]|nr:MAG: hypothetical protein BMS9Abin28_0797 [Anaerolineae bacterium]
MLHDNKSNVIVHNNVMEMEMKLLDDFVKYVSDLTGNTVHPEELSQEKKDRLPIFLSRSYSLHRASIMGRGYLLLIHEHGDEPTPAKAATYAETIRDALREQAVFVFPQLDAFVRDRLIKQGVPFVVPYRHLFLPIGLIDSREQPPRGPSAERQSNALSAPAQVMLLYYLLNLSRTEEWSLKQWSEVLGYSQMSMSRAWRELASHDLCAGKNRGRSLVLRFPKQSRETWNRASPHLQNPVRHRISATIGDTDYLHLRKSGLTALAERTLISSGDRVTYATALANWKAAIDKEYARKASRADESSAIIETWRYDPAILSPEEESVDPLSLFLSLRDDPDERIQGSLEDMIDRFSWQM